MLMLVSLFPGFWAVLVDTCMPVSIAHDYHGMHTVVMLG